MSPCDPKPTARALITLGLVMLSMACNGRANTAELRPDESAGTQASTTSLLEPSEIERARKAIEASLGAEVKALELRAYPTRWVLQAEDPDRPGRLFQLEYEGGRLGQPLEMTVRGAGELRDNLFLLGDVALDAMPQLVDQARRAVDPDDGVVDYVLIRRGLPFERAVRLRAFVKSPRRDGYLDADQQGQLVAK